VTNATTGAFVSVRRTLDGGATWALLTKSGTFFTSDFGRVPGTTMFISTGAATGWSGSSYSTDSGRTWTTIDTTVQHTAFGAFDINNAWSGGFVSGGTGGIFKLAPSILCGDGSISSGVSSVNVVDVCFGDTLMVSTTGVVSPTVGTTHGFAIIVSSGDISGNNDPLNAGGILGGTGVITGTPGVTALPNDGTIFVPGTYYFTPVVFGNATGSGNITAVTLDPSCTTTGTSVMIVLHAAGDLACTPTGIGELTSNVSVYAFQQDMNTINVKINAASADKAVVKMFDLAGRTVFTKNCSVAKGENSQLIDASVLGAGTYFVSVETSAGRSVVKVVKL
jgi:hypothetical protein